MHVLYTYNFGMPMEYIKETLLFVLNGIFFVVSWLSMKQYFIGVFQFDSCQLIKTQLGLSSHKEPAYSSIPVRSNLLPK